MKKLPRDAEASNVLVGEVDFLDTPFVAFVRLQQAVMLGALTEVPVPTRYPTDTTTTNLANPPNIPHIYLIDISYVIEADWYYIYIV